MRAGEIVTIALLACVAGACGPISPEPRLAFASRPPTDADCRDERLGPVEFRLDPAEPGGALIVTDREGTALELSWDPRFGVEVDGEVVSIEGPDGRAVTSPMTLIGSRLPGGRFLVCDVRAAD